MSDSLGSAIDTVTHDLQPSFHCAGEDVFHSLGTKKNLQPLEIGRRKKKKVPGDSSRALLIPNRWVGHLTSEGVT